MPAMQARCETTPVGGRHSLLALLITALGLGIAPGCKKEKKAEDGTTEGKTVAADENSADTVATDDTADEGDSTADDSAGADKPSVEVVLLDPGSEPRQELRYKLEKGHKEQVAMTITMTMKMEMPGMPSTPISMPPMKMVMDLEIAEKLDDDKARYKFEVTETDILDAPDVQPMVAKTLKSEIGKVVGMKGSAVVDTRGFNTDATLEMPPGLNPQMSQMMDSTQQSMDQMSSPLPEEPVGVGAKWELNQNIEQNGINVKQKTTFELVELEGSTGKLKASIMQTAEPQTAQMPGGVSAEVKSLNSSGEGEINFDLANLVPQKASIDLKTDSDMKVKQGGMSQEVKMSADTSMVIEQQ